MNKLAENKGLLIDLEGVLYSDNQLISGSIEIVKELKKKGLK
ncbi:MAG: TIGR01458 family HAD-type hydrolase, partial [Rickettsiales bacterium]|nr:TIGR01458 family HAD-type hydrolase [Rickettsiales bacterium]